jgi:hypothetical protein
MRTAVMCMGILFCGRKRQILKKRREIISEIVTQLLLMEKLREGAF